ncbi:MAG TPA: SDR family NAD(P)-dependent oxidoreductase [Halothiobacillus sp.]|nr:MAG: hypothetical protein B7Z82_08090 [Halothiobacillus sp. 20-54-6]HQT42731.1 SDR family NAD(P)-dependent oxidoreductase [Halothiobacillus sp.]
MSSSPLVFIGYGDIAARVARLHPQHETHAIARQAALRPAGHTGAWVVHPHNLDTDTTPTVPESALWLYFAPPPNTGVTDTRVARWLAAMANQPAPQHVIYASTTGVYGDHHGEWITEHTPATPAHDRGRRRLDAEAQFTERCAARAIPLTLLRITGIYACDRLPIERIKAGAPVVCLEESPWSNRIHAEDCADICAQLIARTESGQPVTGVFNLSDNQPRPMTELYLATAAHFGLPAPPCLPLSEVLAQSTAMAREFLTESKRIDARAIQRALNWQPRYPNLAATLAECRQAEMSQSDKSGTINVTK